MKDLTAGDVMSRVLVTVEADESPLMAWELMARSHVHHLPVVDRAGKVAGIVTREDIAANWSGGPAILDRHPVGELVAGEDPGASKWNKAQQIGTEVIDEAKLAAV